MISSPVVNPKVVTVSNPLRGSRGVDQEADLVNQKYSAVLDHLLTPPQVKEQLMKTQSLDKKKQMCEMYKQLFEQGGGSQKDSQTAAPTPAVSKGWGEKENALLSTILKAKTPDLQSLTKLKIILSSANREFMTSFLESGGISSLLKIVEQRLLKRPFTELDIAILYEILSCFKAVMNNPIGMEGIASTPGSIDILTRCLRFDYKLFSILVLEMLSVCCFYSEITARDVLHGMRQNAKYYKEAPFAAVVHAIIEQDIEVKAATLQFVNNLIMGVDDTNIRLSLRTELGVQLFDEKLDQANHRLDKELDLLNNIEGPTADTSTVQNKLKRKSVVAMYGPKALDDKKVEAMLKSPNGLNLNISEAAGEVAKEKFEVKSNSLSMTVCPQDGTMAGLLHAAKNTEKLESKFLDMVGGKKTKRRWFELDSDNFKWCAGHDKEQDYKGTVSIGTISDIRPFSTDPFLLASTTPKLHCFEIETLERTYAFGCESEVEKEHWLNAFQRARDNYIISKGTYKMQYRELSVADVVKFTDRFRKDIVVYTTIAMEDRRNQVETCGFNLDNVDDLSRYLIHEATAMGSVGQLQSILYELLVIPPGMEGMWEALRTGVMSLRERAERNADKARDESFNHSSVVDMFQLKTTSNGAQYNQVNKLAIKAMNCEQEVERLQGEIKALKETIDKLQKGGAAPSSHFPPSGRSAPLPPPPQPSSQETSVSTTHTAATVSPEIASSPLPTQHTSLRKAPPLPPPPVVTQEPPKEQVPTPVVSPPVKNVAVEPTPTPAPLPTSREVSAPSSSAIVPPISVAAVTPLAPAAQIVATDDRYAKYDKMRKMLPEGAVRQKMMIEGFSDGEIDAYFNGEIPPAAPAPPAVPIASSAPTDERYAKYEKMRKMLPEGAVRQKMMIEGFSDAEIDAFFNGEVAPPAPAPATIVQPVVSSDDRYAKYDKMRKMLPEGAVRQKMQIEGFSDTEIDAYFSGEIAAAPKPAAPVPVAAAPAVDERYAKYEKMRKMLPEGAVRQKMQIEGFSQAEIDAFFNGEVAPAAAALPATPPPVADERYAKYDKMRKMLPEGAVRQKMQVEGFSQAEIDAYFNGEILNAAAPVAPPSTPAPVVDERYAKFDKMRKMLPEGAVRQKMQIEGFTPAEIDAFFNGTVATAAVAAPPAAVVDERYAKYDKMRKMLPEGAVRQKMQVEGFSQAEIDAFFSGAVGSAPPPSVAVPPVVDERYEKYEKMRKMLPEGAVRQKMQGDGFTPAEIDKFFGSSSAAAPPPVSKPVAVAPKAAPVDSPPEGMAEKPKIKPSVKLKGLFWTKLKNLEVQNTIWYKLQEYGMSEEDRKMLEEWFAAKVTDVSSSSAGGNSAKAQQSQQPKLLSVLDGKRTQNISILMGKLRKGPEEITQMLIAIDPNELTVELTSRLIENLPTTEELNAIKEFKDPSVLDNASKLIFEFNRIPRLAQRMECHELAFVWGNNANTASKDINVVNKACKELQDSKVQMEKILSMILSIGNYINGDTARGQAYGVKIDVFSKLLNLKAMLPSQGSLMNFLALLVEHHANDVMGFSQSWVAIWVAADIQFKQLQTDVNQLETQVNKVTMELSKIKEGKENPGLDGTLEDINGAVTKPLHARLTAFLNVAKPQLATIKESLATTEKNLEKVMNEYGESLKATVEGDPCKKFFSTIVEFARGFQAAYDDNVAKRQAQEKAAKALAEAESKAQAKGPSMGSMAAIAKMAVASRQQKPSDGGAPPPPPPPPPPPSGENLFGRFHQAQNASAGDVLAEFKSKLNKRIGAQNN